MENSFSFDECDVCGDDHPSEACPQLGLETVEEESTVSIPLSRARITLPHYVEAVDGEDGSVSVVATELIPAKTKLGPFEARKTTQIIEAEDGFLLRIFQKDGSFICLDTSDQNSCNWLCLIPTALSKFTQDQNCMALQMGSDIFFLTMRNIPAGEELSVWYAPHYAKKLGKSMDPDGVTTILLGRQTFVQPEELVTFAAAPGSEDGGSTSGEGTPLPATPVRVVSAVPVKSTPPPPPRAGVKRVYRHSADGGKADMMYAKTPMVKDEPYTCKYCRQVTGDEFSLKIHMATYHVENMKEGTTELQSRKSRVVHSLDHKGLRKCRQCDAQFSDIKELAKHVREHIRKRSNQDRRRKRAPNSQRLKRRKPTIPKVLLEGEEDLGEIPGENLEEIPEEHNEESQGEIPVEDDDVSEDYLPGTSALSPPRKSPRFLSPTKESQDSAETPPRNSSGSQAGKSPGKHPKKKSRGSSPNSGAEGVIPGPVHIDKVPEVSTASTSRKSRRIAAKESSGDALASKPWMRKGFRLVGGNTGIESVKVTPLIQVKDVTVLGEGHEGHSPVDESKSHTLVLSLGSLSKTPATAPSMPTSGGKKTKRVKQGGSDSAAPSRRSMRTRSAKGEAVTVDEGESSVVRALDMDHDNEVGNFEEVGNEAQSDGNIPSEDPSQNNGEDYYTVTVDLEEVKGGVEEATLIETEVEQEEMEEEINEESLEGGEKKYKRKKNDDEEEDDENSENGDNVDAEPAVRYALLDENDMYVCDNCNMRFKTFEELEEHEVTHKQGDRRKKRKTTKSAEIEFKPKGKFQKLQPGPLLTGKEVRNEDGLWECVKCGKAFDKLPYLERHMRAHTDLFKCNRCDRRFARNETLQKHRCAGNPEDEVMNDKQHFCEFCGAGFTSHTYLLRHMASHTDDFKCEFCPKRFGSKNALRQHVIKCRPDVLIDSSHAEKFFPCDQCDKVFSRKATLVNHSKLHSGEYRCEICQRCFSSLQTHERHVAEGSCREPGVGAGEAVGSAGEEEVGRHACHECDKTFKIKKVLNLHVAREHSELALFCSMCEKSFMKKEELLKHMIECAARVQSETQGRIVCIFCDGEFSDPVTFRHHFQEHTHPFKCETCSKMFLRQTGLDNHQCDSSRSRPQVCPICGKEIRTAHYMEKHISVAHGEEQQCKVCERKFKRADHFLNHKCINKDGVVVMEKKRRTREQRRAEGIQDDCTCPVCGKTFSVQSNLTKHMKSHGERTEPCPTCGKLFFTQFAVKAHMKHVHEESHNVCQYCGKVMKCKNSLYGHINQYHQNTVTLYECEICGKQFRQKGNVKKHQLIHSDKKTYSCKFCDRKFRFPEQHRRHELWHSGAKHQCTFCGKKFVMPFELKKHLRVYHSGLVYACKYCNLECRYLHTMKRHLERRHLDHDEWHSDPIQFIKGLVGHAGDPAHAQLPAPPSGRSGAHQQRDALLQNLQSSSYMIVEDEVELDEVGDSAEVEGVGAGDVGVPTETRFIITNTDGRTTLAQLPEGASIAGEDIEISQIVDPGSLQIDASTMDSILAGFGTGVTSGTAGEHPYIVAEVQGVEGADGQEGATQTIIIQTDGSDGTFQGIEVGSTAHEVATALQGLTSIQETVVGETITGETETQVVTTTEGMTEEDSVTIIGDITQSDGQSVPIALQGANVSEGEGYIIVPMKQVLDEPKAVSILSKHQE